MIEIASWNATFENADTRKRQRLKSFHAPSGIESRGLINLLCKCEDQQRALAAFGVFQLLCQLSATLPAEHRGRLIHSDNSPMSLEFLARLLRVDLCHLSAAVELLKAPGVEWIIEHGEKSNLPPACQSSPGFVQGEGEGEGTNNNNKARGDLEEGQPCIDGYPTRQQAIAVAGNLMIREEVASRWWLDRDGEGWQSRNGQPMRPEGWQSNLKSYNEKWLANEARGTQKGSIAANSKPIDYGKPGIRDARFPSKSKTA